MRMHAKVPNQVGPCPLCGRKLKLDFRGKPWAHKCPHGEPCCYESRLLGMRESPLCVECKASRENSNG